MRFSLACLSGGQTGLPAAGRLETNRLFNYCEKQPRSSREAKSHFIFVLFLRLDVNL
jgi:hypothetical protein